jgi:hypothetical protein
MFVQNGGVDTRSHAGAWEPEKKQGGAKKKKAFKF